MTVVVLIVGYERIMILRSIRKFDDYIYAILFVVFLVPHFWIPFVGWGVAQQVAIYKTNWGKFQVFIRASKNKKKIVISYLCDTKEIIKIIPMYNLYQLLETNFVSARLYVGPDFL